MSKIFCIVGKSCSGKDTLYEMILSKKWKNLIPVIPYTTRPKRNDEIEGLNYHFVNDEQMKEYERSGRIIERRQYHTTQGVWNYFTLKFPMQNGKNYLLITTLDGVRSLIGHYGQDTVFVIYLHTDDKTRLLRCIKRESAENSPDYSEVCRRFIADQEDFAEEKLSGFKNFYPIDTQASIEQCMEKWEKIYENVSYSEAGSKS